MLSCRSVLARAIGLIGTCLPLVAAANLPPERLIPFSDLLLAQGEAAAPIPLADRFRDPDLGGIPVRVAVRLGTESRFFDLALFDQTAPRTTANFLRYVDTGRYAANFIHRSVPGFVVQGGGYYFPSDTTFDYVPTYDPVVNEPGSSNVRGTVAMAKLGGDANSATSQWFVNLADNSANLDAQNGGFTVFARVLGDGMATVDAIAAVPRYNAGSIEGAWTDLPLTTGSLARVNFVETSVTRQAALSHTVESSDPTLVSATIVAGALRIAAATGRPGTAIVTLTTTDLEGGELETAIEVVVEKTLQTITGTTAGGVQYQLGAFTPSVTASSGLPVGFEIVSGPIEQAEDGTLRLTGVGEVVLRAVQPGDATYKATASTLSYTIEPVPVTVRATDRYKLVNRANPPLGLVYQGLPDGETAASIDVPPTLSTTAVTRSPVGTYPITVSGGADPLFAFTRVPATLHVLNFVGTYEALIERSDQVVGHLRVTVTTDSARYSATLIWDALAVPLTVSGPLVLDPLTGRISGFQVWPATKTRPELRLDFGIVGRALTATVRAPASGEESAGSGARRYVLPARTTAPWVGAHTLLLRTPEGAALAGHGYSTASIAGAGVLTLSGRLADGRTLTGSLYPDDNGRYRVFLRPYGNRVGSRLCGELALAAHPDTARFPGRYYVPFETGRLVWAKSAGATDTNYRAGFGPITLGVALDPWLAPVTKKPVITLTDRLGPGGTNPALEHTAPHLGAYEALLPSRAAWATAARAVAATGATSDVTKWTLNVASATGVFSGSFLLKDTVAAPTKKNPDQTRVVSRTVRFYGLLRQRPDMAANDDQWLGAGYFLLAPAGAATSVTSESGALVLTVPSAE